MVRQNQRMEDTKQTILGRTRPRVEKGGERHALQTAGRRFHIRRQTHDPLGLWAGVMVRVVEGSGGVGSRGLWMRGSFVSVVVCGSWCVIWSCLFVWCVW
jgi:hypothetical protein